VIDTLTNTVSETVRLNAVPQELTVSPDGTRVYVSLRGSGDMAIIDTTVSPMTVTDFDLGGNVGGGDTLWGIGVSPDDQFALLAHFGIDKVSSVQVGANPITSETSLRIINQPGNIASQPRYVAFAQPDDNPPTFGPGTACGATLGASAGTLFGFTVTADDDRWVTLDVAGLPGSSTMNEALPLTEVRTVFSSFSWTPTPGDVGSHTITFTATDSSGQQATCVITVDVTIPDTPPSLTSAPDAFGQPLTPNLGDTVSFNVNASDETGVTLSVADLPAGATMSPALPLNGTDVSSDFVWPIVGVPAGTYQVTFTAADTTHAPVTKTATIEVPEPPEPDEIEFAAFRLRAAKIFTRGYFADSFLFHGYFNVDLDAGDDINPAEEEVTINIEGTEWIIPAGEFRARLRGRVFRYRGTVNGTKLFVYITQRGRRGGRYNVSVIGWKGSFADPQNPLQLCVTVGDDFGCAERRGWIR
jgi:hypothetical protein